MHPLKHHLMKFADSYLSLSEKEMKKNIMNKIQKSLDKSQELGFRDYVYVPYCICLISKYPYVNEMKKCLSIKYICFYIIGLIFLIFFWYYLSSFGAVYKNSQKYPFINTLISIIIALFYPFFINLVPGIFRIHSLNKNKKNECFYNISKGIQLL